MKNKAIWIAVAAVILLAAVCIALRLAKPDPDRNADSNPVAAESTVAADVSDKKESVSQPTEDENITIESKQSLTVPDEVHYTIEGDSIIIDVGGEDDLLIIESPEDYTNDNLPSGGKVEIK